MYYKKSHIKVIFFLLIILPCFIEFEDSFAFSFNMKNPIEITAHRGSSINAPENTISSIELAIDEKAEYIEIDARTTKDNQVILCHDNNLTRVSGVNKNISDSTYDDLEKLDVGYIFNVKFSGERIPTLDEVLKLAKNKINVNIDMKVNGNDDMLPELVAKLIEKYNMEDTVVVSSTSYDSIKKVKKINPKIKIGYIVSSMPNNIDINYIDFISIEFAGLNKDVIDILHKCNKKVYVWTLNNKDQAIKAIELGADNIITDNVNMVKNILKY